MVCLNIKVTDFVIFLLKGQDQYYYRFLCLITKRESFLQVITSKITFIRYLWYFIVSFHVSSRSPAFALQSLSPVHVLSEYYTKRNPLHLNNCPHFIVIITTSRSFFLPSICRSMSRLFFLLLVCYLYSEFMIPNRGIEPTISVFVPYIPYIMITTHPINSDRNKIEVHMCSRNKEFTNMFYCILF